MEWGLALKAQSGWGDDVETIEVGRLERKVVGLTEEEIGPTLAEEKELLGELARLILSTQMEEQTSLLPHPMTDVRATCSQIPKVVSRLERCSAAEVRWRRS